jgi:hypothetical protein
LFTAGDVDQGVGFAYDGNQITLQFKKDVSQSGATGFASVF